MKDRQMSCEMLRKTDVPKRAKMPRNMAHKPEIWRIKWLESFEIGSIYGSIEMSANGVKCP